MEPAGYIKAYRKLFESDLWLNEPFTRGQAWLDLIHLAKWKAGKTVIRGNTIYLARGQLAGSSVFLAERWRWSRGKVARFLDELENEQQIGQQKSAVTTVITITNYDAYQQTDSKTDSRRTADGQQTDTHEEGKKDKKEEETNTSRLTPEEFVEKWNSFAAKKGIPTARRLTDARRKKIKTRLGQNGWLEEFREALGKLPLPGDGWQPDLDWFIRNDSNANAIVEGRFDWRGGPKPVTANGERKSLEDLLAERNREA